MIENKIDVIESEIKEDKELELVNIDINLHENQHGRYINLLKRACK